MSQNGKLMPNLDQQSTKILNLTVLQRIDPFVEEILITAAHVTFYEFNIDLSQWSRKDVEGSLFVVKRNTQPRFQFIVMNRRNTDNLVENLLGDFEYEVQVPYLLYRNAAQEVNGIWFYNARECEEVANLFNRILNAYSKVPPKTKVSSTKRKNLQVGETLLNMVVEESQGSKLTRDAPNNMKSTSAETCHSSIESSEVWKSDTGGVLATPTVRNLAKQYGVGINHIVGTGKDGRVLKEDVLAHAVQKGEEHSFSRANSVEHFQGEEELSNMSAADRWQYEDKIVPIRGFHRAMIKSMTLAAKIPHFHYVEEINCNALVNLKTFFQEENRDPEVKHTFLPFMIKTLSMALSKYPLLNSCFNEELQEITIKGSHNIGIAMATPHGLVVPNLKRVQSLSILEITKELVRLQQLALANNLCPEDISGGTITLSNIGAIGGKFGSPLLNLPEVSIIAIGRLQKVPQFVDDEKVYPASIMTVNIGADHRVLDGATVARFCNEWKLYIEKPEQLLLHMK